MFVTFFHELKSAGVPVTLREYLTLMEAMQADLAGRRVEDFYYLSRAALVKDERNLDKFDRVFGHVFKGLELMEDALAAEIPAEWLKKLAEKYLTEEEKKQIEAMGGLDKLLETLKKRMAEQKGRHQGGNKWIGTGGTSPFGNSGYNPEGVRIGQDEQQELPRGEGLGQARVQGPRRRGRARHPQHQGRAAAAAQVRPHRRARRARSRRHHQGHRAQGLSRHPDAAGAAQFREGADVLRHRRLDGLAHQGDRGAVLGGAHRVQAHGAFLLPQLPVRAGVEGEPPALPGDHADLGRAAQISARLQGDLRRRRLDEPVRDFDRRAARSSTTTRRRARPGWSASRAPIRPASGSIRCRRASGSTPIRSASCASSWAAGCIR